MQDAGAKDGEVSVETACKRARSHSLGSMASASESSDPCRKTKQQTKSS